MLLSAHGPEVRMAVHSGLLHALRRGGAEVTVVARQSGSAVWKESGLRPRAWPEPDWHPDLLSRLQWRSRQASSARFFKRSGGERWRHYLPADGARRTSRALLLPELQGRAFGLAERVWARLCRQHEGWRAVVEDADIVLLASHSAPWALAAMRAAIRSRVALSLLVNSWKDLAVCPHFSMAPDLVLAWNSDMADAYRAALGTRRRTSVVALGSLHAAAVFAHRNNLSRDDFCAAHGLDPDRPYVLYTAASPSAVDGEPAILAEIVRELEKATPDVQVLLRCNPMEDGGRFGSLLSERNDLRLQRPLWEWDERLDWCCCLPADLPAWAGALRWAACNISVPSTVTLESAMFGTPVVNVAFDPDGVPPERSCVRFWHAPFYTRVRESGLARRADGPREVAEIVRAIIAGTELRSPAGPCELARNELGDWTRRGIERAAQAILGLAR